MLLTVSSPSSERSLSSQSLSSQSLSNGANDGATGSVDSGLKSIASNYTDPESTVRLIAPNPIQPHQPLFVFLPGMDGTGTLLRPQLNRLLPWFDIRCVSIPPQDSTGWESLARQVSHLIEAEVAHKETLLAQQSSLKKTMPLQRRRSAVYLCGESFGGCLAMQVLTQSPHLFDRAILVNPASSFRRLPWMQLGSLVTRQLPNAAYRFSTLGMVPFLMDPFRVARRDRIALAAAMESVPAKTAAWRMSLLSEFEVERLPLERMTHPVLLIAGESDRLLPSKREAQSLQARFPNAKLTLLPDSGHACLLETETNLQKILQQQGFLTP